MHLLLVNQFYPPDVAPTGQHLHSLARCLVARGHSVEVWCSRGSYEGGGRHAASEVLDGVLVRRVAAFAFGRAGGRRAADYASFLLAVASRGLSERKGFDATLCLTTPPYVGRVLPSALGRRAGVVAQWVMDLYPDVLAAHGGVRSGGIVDRALRGLTRAQLRRSALVLALGPRMEDKVRAYVGRSVRVERVPMWAPLAGPGPTPEAALECRCSRGWRSRDTVLLYSGNMGLGHRMEEFLEAAGRSSGEVTWAFAGGGRRREEVERFAATHPSARVQLLPYVPQEDLAASLAAADVHLVSLRSPWQGLIVPSKLQAAFGLGRPVIFVGPRDSEPADWIAESGGGWRVEEGDVEGLLAAVASARDPAERRRRGEAGRAYGRLHFDREANTRRIAELLEEAVYNRAHPSDPGGPTPVA